MSVIYQINCPLINIKSYLMGTFHLNHISFNPLLDIAYKYLVECKHYCGEIDFTTPPPKLDHNTLFQFNSDTLKEKFYILLQKNNDFFIKKYGINLLSIENQPIPIAIGQISILLLKSRTLEGSIDQLLFQKAVNLNCNCHGMETWEEQYKIMASLDTKSQLNTLKKIILHPKKYQHSLLNLINWYTNGDIEKLYKKSKKTLGKNKGKIIYSRNINMINKMTSLLQLNESVFFFSRHRSFTRKIWTFKTFKDERIPCISIMSQTSVKSII